MYSGYTITHEDDLLVANVMVPGANRKKAIAKMKRTLHDFIIDGIYTTIPFLITLLEYDVFVEGNIDKRFVDSFQ